ncbi:hypothetical protein TNCV_3643161 [Trichonephila clavipes]|nr:hypothetical protein TNCV_3643161 [Trichonephila clavipes]
MALGGSLPQINLGVQAIISSKSQASIPVFNTVPSTSNNLNSASTEILPSVYTFNTFTLSFDSQPSTVCATTRALKQNAKNRLRKRNFGKLTNKPNIRIKMSPHKPKNAPM